MDNFQVVSYHPYFFQLCSLECEVSYVKRMRCNAGLRGNIYQCSPLRLSQELQEDINGVRFKTHFELKDLRGGAAVKSFLAPNCCWSRAQTRVDPRLGTRPIVAIRTPEFNVRPFRLVSAPDVVGLSPRGHKSIRECDVE